MSHLRVLPEQGESPSWELRPDPVDAWDAEVVNESRPAITVVASVTAEHDRDDVAELLRLAARSAAVDLRLEFTGPDDAGEPALRTVPERAGPERAVPEREARVRVLVPARLVLCDGEPVALTRLEFDLLLFLAQRPGRVFDREDLLGAVWGADPAPPGEAECSPGRSGGAPRSVTRRTVDVHVRRIRSKLGRDLGVISTIRGVGYRLDTADLRVEDRRED